jgi:hypothetical protein
VWLVVAIAVGVVVLHRPVSVVELSPEEAEERFRATFDELTDAISRAAEQRVAGLLLPVAGGMVAAGEGMIEATDDVMEAADEITDALEERVPGGFVVNRVVDFALVPGRFGVRVLRIVLRTGPTD